MPADESRSLATSFASYSATLHGTVGLGYAPVGGERAFALGDRTGGVAWSTSKVPLAIAALRAVPVAAKPFVTPTITRSDNAAAERLWSMLGPPDVAAAAVQAVLEEGGDTGTRVQSRRVRPEYTAFGQTEWSTTRQALFTAHLPCIEAGAEVLALMRTLDPEQRWGLARLPGAAAKGGWGPDEQGAHLVRQLGVLPNGSGWTAVVLGARPSSGTFADGIALLDQLTQWVDSHLRQLPAGRCQR
ncbi:hypothetical protein ABZ942_28910 [Nocardia sp. NPDC046473]|uniref:hypothetical protein n=1 Tax=Nocardia sp. NPDC046473 TaxID=3155733 RepID=UPI0033CAD410